MVPPRVLALLLLPLLTGCVGGGGYAATHRPQVHQEGDEADRLARALLEADGYPSDQTRLRPNSERFFERAFGRWLPIPNLDTLFGLSYEPRYHYLPSQNAFILLHRGRPPTILPIDPDRPIGPQEETPEEAWQRFRRVVERDLERVLRERKDGPQP